MTKAEIRPARPADPAGILALYRQLHPLDPVLDPGAAETVWSALLSRDSDMDDPSGRLAQTAILTRPRLSPLLTLG